ncbi:MAG: TolC family protein [Bacteroidota bacterium]
MSIMLKIKKYIKFTLLLIGAIISFSNIVQGQNSKDSLSLNKIISTVVQNHPSVKEAIEAINSANAGIGLAKAGYYPNIDVSASYTRLGPVQEITFPGFGTFQLYPANNYAANLNYFQTLFDFGKTAKGVTLAKENKNLSQLTIEQVKQKLAITTTMFYYSMVYLQEAIKINKEQQKTLEEHLAFIEKKQETGSATPYEILSTKVKISTVESIGIDLQTSLRNQITELNSLMGQTENTSFSVKQELDIKLPNISQDSILSYAFEHRDEIKITKEKAILAALKYKLVKAQDNPSLNVQLSGGGKNGYIPDLNAIKPNFLAGLGLKIPIFEGSRLKFNLSQAKSNITYIDYETELAKRTISVEVAENEENLKASLKKIERFSLQLSQSQEAFELAQTSFKAGSITNLDLLDAATTISESNLLLLKSKIEYATNIFKLKIAVGERLY